MTTSPTDSPIVRALQALADGARIGEALVADAFGQIMRGDATPAQVGALLAGLRVQGETAEEVAGAARALRAAMITVPVADRAHLVDTCGTGGGALPTFNISTAAALVAVGAGAVVAKHGNRSFTSRCGSADVLEALGVPIALDAAGAASLLARAGMTFLFAPAFHPAMRHVAPVRRELKIATIMNVIGPLANPAAVQRQLIGVADAARGPVLADAARRLGAEHVLVVHGRAGMDEIAPHGPTSVWEVRDGTVARWELDPQVLGLASDDAGGLAGGEPASNAQRIERLLEQPQRDPVGRAAVGLNAGAALYVAGVTDDVPSGVERALDALESGAGAQALARLRRESAISTSG